MSDKKIKDHAADALKEAEARRSKEKEKLADEVANEVGGRDGPEATRYGDWEKNGITSDF